MAENFAELEKRDGRTVMCPRCGRQPVGGRVHIIVRRQIKHSGTTKQVASTQLAMCEMCCAQVFTELEDGLYAVIDPDSRSAREHRRLKPE